MHNRLNAAYVYVYIYIYIISGGFIVEIFVQPCSQRAGGW